MSAEHTNEFQYGGFSVSRQNIEAYLSDMEIDRKLISWATPSDMSFSAGIIQSMIFCIANNDIKFDVRDTELCRTLEDLIIRGGYDRNGIYSADARAAMRNLRALQGKNPDDQVLQDKTSNGIASKVKSGLKKLFGFGRKDPKQPTPAPQTPTPKADKSLLYRMAATFTGLVAVGASLMFMPNKINKTTNSDAQNNDKIPTFKSVIIPTTPHHTTHTYNLTAAPRFSPQVTIKSIAAAAPRTSIDTTATAPAVTRPTATQPTATKNATTAATDSLSMQLTRASKSSLNILLGAKKADALCRQVQSQIDAGIFDAPHGISAERIAHAMTMSRIYEGKSIILNALRATTKLTATQQTEFNRHIEEIGDLGVKIQKRMASKHKLSNHSKFKHASQTAKKQHIQNLKQLKQMRKMAHTR